MIIWIRKFLVEESGQDLVEYSLLLVLLGTIVLLYFTGIGVNITSILSKIGAKLEEANSAVN